MAAVSAAAAGDKDQGRRIALNWCVECHQVEDQAPASDLAPPFPAIANDPTYTDARLRGWLSDPHPPMPNIQLSRQEIDDLIAYLRSLRSD